MKTTTWYVDGYPTHGIEGVYMISAMTDEEIDEMDKPHIGAIGPDEIIEGTTADVVEWLRKEQLALLADNKTLELDTDSTELNEAWKAELLRQDWLSEEDDGKS